jgi:ribonuclease R
MKEQILQILEFENKALDIHEISEKLGINNVDEFKEVLKALNELEDEYQIYHTNKDKFMLFNNSHLKIGTLLSTTKDFAFVDIEGDEDVFVHASNLNGALHKDKVIVEITSKQGLRLEGRILKVVNRSLKNVVGEIVYIDNQAHLKLDDEKFKIDIIIKPDKLMNAMEGHKVVAKVTTKIKNNLYNGEVIKVIGHKNDPGVDILSIAYKYGINDTFPDEVIKELDDIPDSVSEIELNNRRDLRDHMIFTIDGDDTKDIDDAIEVKKLDNGNYELGVHIADVSYYVKEGSALYKEAYERGTSVYLADRVIPMLPHKLSNGICSLNPGVDRLTISCVMEIDDKGNVKSYDIFPSVIKSRIQMTYKKVNKILEENIIPEGYEEYADTLILMQELASKLRENKVRRGYIDFEIDEAKIIVDEDGKAIDIKLRERGKGEKLIEDFMIAANESVASYIFYMEYPFIYRVHGTPSEEKMKNFLTYVSSCGYTLKGNFKEIYPSTFQDILGQLKETKEYSIFSSLLLRSMQKAIYDTTNIGHFGLGSKCYTHFTSPIRRFPDTTVHRLLHKYIFDGKNDLETQKGEELKLIDIAKHSSQKERDSVECEREVDDMKMAEYMMNHIGESYTGMISSITKFGIFVQLPNLIEGLIKLEDLKGDYYTFDESTISLIGKKDKKGYHLGDTLDVVVVSANKETKMIDFVLAKDYQDDRNK